MALVRLKPDTAYNRKMVERQRRSVRLEADMALVRLKPDTTYNRKTLSSPTASKVVHKTGRKLVVSGLVFPS